MANFYKQDPQGNLNRIYAQLIPNAPPIKQAEAKLLQARRDLAQAELNLRYCDVVSEIDGVVTRRNVNPGNNVQAGQSLMAVRSLTEIWIDANFKETQLADLRIGQRAVCEVDMYGGKQRVRGPHHRLHDGHRPDAGPAAAAKRDRQLREDRAAAAGADRADRLRSGQAAAVRRALGRAARVLSRSHPRGRTPGSSCNPTLPCRKSRRSRLRNHRSATAGGNGSPDPSELMSSVALPSAATTRRAINPWFVAIAVVVPTFMEVLDTTIANVALRYIAGGLSAAETDSEWVITSYLAANAIVLPITGWLSAHLGRRNYFLLSIAVFTLASGLCGMATSLPQIILFRVIQGLAGGGLQPSSQAILLDSFPPEKQGTAMTMFGIAALIGPIVGPTLGGWLVVNYNWRWIFYINLPVGLVALAASYFLVDDPEYLEEERAEAAEASR